MRYFAYGSNMVSDNMRYYCPGAEVIGSARLDGHVLGFNHFSAPRGCGVADIEPGDGAVWGVLYEVNTDELARMESIESAPGEANAYEPCTVSVLAGGTDGSVAEALTYRVRDKQTWQRPSAEYLATLLDGAREHGLPDEYAGWLEEVYLRLEAQHAPAAGA